MTRTSKALKRLGVAGLAVVTIGAGLPALLAAGAQAAGPVTSVTLQPHSNAGAAGSCVAYTVTASDASANTVAGATITVSISDTGTAPSGFSSTTQDVNFCTLPTGTTQPASPTNVTDQPAGTGTTDTGTFTTGSNGTVVIGVTARQPGQVFVRAFYDANGDHAFTAGEPQDNDTTTFTAGGPAGSNANQDAASSLTATPTPEAVVVGESATFTVTVKNASGHNLNGVVVSYTTKIGATGQGQTFANNSACGSTNNNGVVICSIPVTAPGTDNVTIYVNQTGITSTPGPDPGEPQADVVINATPAPVGRQVALLCGPNPAQNPLFSTANSGAGTAACTNGELSTSRTFVATVTNSNGVASTDPTLLSFSVAGGSGDETVTPSCTTSGTSGANNCTVTVSDATPISGEVLTVTATIRGTSQTSKATLTFTNVPQDARNIALTPKTATTTQGAIRTFTATVTDSDGKPVPGVNVDFTETGPGAFRNGGSAVSATTDANGQATADVTSLSNESGTETITASISSFGSQCGNAANTGTDPRGNTLNSTTRKATAGNCSDTATNTIGTASPSASASPTSSNGGRGTLSTSTPDIQPNIQGILNASNLTSSAAYELRCYSRPSTTYFTARSATTSASGSTLEFRILPGSNTRCYVRPAGNDALASNSVVINVHTTLSLSTVRTGVRSYIFQGRNLPRRAGQLITLYRVTASGQEIRTSNLVTDSSGIYRVTRKFTGTGTFQFKVRTSQTLNNAAGVSNVITVNVH